VHKELTMRLKESRRELLQAREQLSKVEQEHLVMALITRIDIRGNNQVKITLRLAPDVVHSLPILLSGASRQLGSVL